MSKLLGRFISKSGAPRAFKAKKHKSKTPVQQQQQQQQPTDNAASWGDKLGPAVLSSPHPEGDCARSQLSLSSLDLSDFEPDVVVVESSVGLPSNSDIEDESEWTQMEPGPATDNGAMDNKDSNAKIIELRKRLGKRKSWITESDVLEDGEMARREPPPRSLLERLPPEVLEIILLEIAREDRILACWMCRTNRVFKLYIERAMYSHLALGSLSRDASLTLIHTLRSRPPDFFSQVVHTLTIGLETELHHAITALKVCSSVENLYLADNFPYDPSRSRTTFPRYLQALFALHPKVLSIDIDNHLNPKTSIKASDAFWRNLVQLDLTVHSLESSFLDANLRAMGKLEQMRVSLWPTAHIASKDTTFLPFAETLAGNLPPSLRYCVIFVASRGVLSKWVTSKCIAPVAEGVTDKRLILGTIIQDDEEKRLVEKGPKEHRNVLGQMCLMSWYLEKGVTIWELAEKALRTRENANYWE